MNRKGGRPDKVLRKIVLCRNQTAEGILDGGDRGGYNRMLIIFSLKYNRVAVAHGGHIRRRMTMINAGNKIGN